MGSQDALEVLRTAQELLKRQLLHPEAPDHFDRLLNALLDHSASEFGSLALAAPGVDGDSRIFPLAGAPLLLDADPPQRHPLADELLAAAGDGDLVSAEPKSFSFPGRLGELGPHFGRCIPQNGEPAGLLLLANPQAAYTPEIIAGLEPLLDVFRALIACEHRALSNNPGRTAKFESPARRVESALAASENRFDVLAAQAPIGIMVHDGRGACKFVNPSWCEISGRTAEEAADDGWLESAHPEERQAVAKAWREAISEQSAFEHEYRVHCPFGRIAWVSHRSSPLFDGGGAMTAHIGTVSDITAEVETRTHRAQLEEQIQQAQKLESLGVLAGGIAHDFNNLLLGILGNADLALMELSSTSPGRPYIEDLVAAAQRAAELCRQMLAYSGKGKFVVEGLSLTRLIEEMQHLLEASVSKNVVLKHRLQTDLPEIEADAAQMRQVFVNLITNASDAIGERSGVITVTTGVMNCDAAYLSETYLDEGLPEGDYVFCEVSDTGTGMDAETRKRIFDPFFTTRFAGRGLGLPAVLGIVRAHRGALKVYTEPGEGTTIKVLFPVLAAEAREAPPAESAPSVWRGTGAILFVDDEAPIRHVGARILEKAGFTVLTAANGREGVRLYREHQDRIVLVILDMTMPHMSGADAFREMRRINGAVRVLLSSGYNEHEATDRFAGKGLAGFIQKPYRSSQLIDKVRAALECGLPVNDNEAAE